MLVSFSDISQEDEVIHEHKLKSTVLFALQAYYVLIMRSVASNYSKVVSGVRDSVANTNVVLLPLSCPRKENPVIKKMNPNKTLRSLGIRHVVTQVANTKITEWDLFI